MTPRVTLIIPVYNEEAALPKLFDRLYPVMDALRRAATRSCSSTMAAGTDPCRCCASSSSDGRMRRASSCSRATPASTWRSSRASSSRAATTSSRSMPTCRTRRKRFAHILAMMEEGADYVGTVRRRRHDVWWRTLPRA